MPLEVGDQVVYPACGVARIASLAMRTFPGGDSQMYYEVVSERSTAWVRADDGALGGLRPLTGRDELPHYRDVLRGCPVALNQDARQRRQDGLVQLRRGTLQDMCEMVRDLSGRGWIKPLGEADSSGLRKSRIGLLQEWAAADGVTLEAATAEVNGLLLEARQTYRA